MHMFKISIWMPLVETCPIVSRAELPFGRESLHSKLTSDFRNLGKDRSDLGCYKSQFL